MSYRRWTNAEEQTALEMRGKHTNREIAETLGKTVQGVESFFKRIGARGGRAPAKPAPSTVHDAIAQRLGVVDAKESLRQQKLVRPMGRHEPTELEPVVILGDAHIPYHSRVWWDLLLQVARYLKPKHLWSVGDLVDFYGVSDHDKDPERANRLDEELEAADRCLDELDALGADDKVYVGGNHEDRMRRYLMKNPALARVVSVERLLKLKERGWHYVPYKHHVNRGALHLTHDVGAAGRNAVFRALDVYGHSVVSGHTHRFAYIVEGTATGECKLSATFGWGGDVEQIDYMNLAKARKDWALGFAAGYLDPASGYCYLTPLPVVHGTVCFNGRLFRAA